MSQVTWTAGASSELQELFSPLEDFQTGLGAGLIFEIEKALVLVASHPRIGSYFEKPVRKWLVNGRYGLIYCPEPRRIVVLAMVDMRSDLGPLRRRLREWYGRR
tara:strand:+ start:1833 stop:2144 length:312 start_codon:yes stop_codon:yes gene_type:complete